MRWLVVSISLLVVSAIAAWGQENEGMKDLLTTHSRVNCYDYGYNATLFIPRLYRESKPDSIRMILDFWEKECEVNSRSMQVRILLAIEDGTFSEDLYGTDIIRYLLMFRRTAAYWDYSPGGREDTSEEVFDRFSYQLAERALARVSRQSVAYPLALFYHHDFDTALALMQAPEYRETKLQQSYYDEVHRISSERVERMNYALAVSSWRPQGANKFLGPQPEVTLIMGGRSGAFLGDLLFSFRWGESDAPYTVLRKGTPVSTQQFSGAYIGIQAGYPFIDARRFDLSLTFGGGYDVLHSIWNDPDEEKDRHLHPSANINVGVQPRLFLCKGRGWYVGGQARYNFVWYRNRGGTDLSGNTVSVGVLLGWVSNPAGSYLRKYLNYRE